MNDQPVQPWTPQVAYSETSELTILLAKILTLVAPTSMTTEQQEVWLRAAIDALQDIRVVEVRAIMLELQRSVQRPSQIVPEIAKLVAAKRARSTNTSKAVSPFFLERAIYERADAMRAAAKGDKRKLSDAFEYERQARIESGLPVKAYPKPLSRDELEAMPSHIRDMGVKAGFLTYRNGQLVEAS